MALNPSLQLRQQQRLALTPEVRTRLGLLRMAPHELDEELARLASRNPFLVHTRSSSGSGGLPSGDGAQELVQAAQEPFQTSLLRQLHEMQLSDVIRAAAVYLVGELDETGLLDVDLDDLVRELALPSSVLVAGLSALQSCDPVGIGARSVGECLELQLRAKGVDAHAAQQIVANLSGFARKDWAGLRRALGADLATVRAHAEMLRELTPRPEIVRTEDVVQALRPDLRADFEANGRVRLVLVTSVQASVSLDEAMIARAEADGFAPELVREARAIRAALEMRGKTLQRIGDWIAAKQAAFFAAGLKALVPATRADLAADLGLHPSTIGRAIAGKAIDIEGRLWPISDLFSAALTGANGQVSAASVKKRITELVAGEESDAPLADDAITKLLHSEGVDISRRTVAKYRQGLHIPSSSVRRREARARS